MLDRTSALLLTSGPVLALTGVPSWLALLAGVVVALLRGTTAPPKVKEWTPRLLQLGVVALGAGMPLQRVLKVGMEGLGTTAVSLVGTLLLAYAIGRWLRVERETSLLLGVGTAICGGSAIASVGSVTKPPAEAMSISLAVVFVLNALALVLFPPIGHALGLSEMDFGRWAALAIHDTSSVVGAGLAYGPEALEVATTTKLARALWIAPVTIGVALWRGRQTGQGLRGVKWPWFIAGFLAMAAIFSATPALEHLRGAVSSLGRGLLVTSLFLVGLGLSRGALRQVGWRPLVQGVVTWVIVASAAAIWAGW